MSKFKALPFVALGLLIFAYNDCGKVEFSSFSPSPIGATAVNPPPICNPFGGSGAGLVATGISYVSLIPDGTSFDVAYTLNQGNQTLAHSQYNGTNGLLSDSTQDIISNTVESFFNPQNPYISILNNQVFLQDLNFPDIYFANGFSPQGQTPLQANGQTLDQFFGFRAQSSFIPTWAPGTYQIATLTDDGSLLTISGAGKNNADLVVNNDGGHSMVLGCTETTITVTANSQTAYPLTFDYFQGPPTTIGLIMLYRLVPPDGGLDPLCARIDGTNESAYSTEDKDNYFFQDSANSPTVAEAPYNQLVGPLSPSTCAVAPCQDSGGWKPVEAANFNLPAGTTNPCN